MQQSFGYFYQHRILSILLQPIIRYNKPKMITLSLHSVLQFDSEQNMAEMNAMKVFKLEKRMACNRLQYLKNFPFNICVSHMLYIHICIMLGTDQIFYNSIRQSEATFQVYVSISGVSSDYIKYMPLIQYIILLNAFQL